MRFVPIDSTDRGHVSDLWNWKYLRGIRCILRATYGVVSTNEDFFKHAFGTDPSEFLEIISMPDRYIIYRSQYAQNEARDWRRRFRRFSVNSRRELLSILGRLSIAGKKRISRREFERFGPVLRHYYSTNTLEVG